jgi:multidrug efflux pump subunit AcrA (membrane-fusion protein)
MLLKYLSFFLCVLTSIWADVYYAKAEPFKKHLIKSNVTGKVVFANESVEGRVADNKPIVLIDAKVDEKEKIRLESQIHLLKNSVANYRAVYEKRHSYYASIKNLKTKSKSSKDSAFYAQATAKQSLNQAEIELANTRQTLFSLNKQIKEKRIVFPKWYVYDLHVLEGDYVTLGSPLVTVADISRVKLKLFLSAEDAKQAHKKELYINDQKSDLKLDQVWRMSDSEHLSSYEARLILPTTQQFSQLIKVELK